MQAAASKAAAFCSRKDPDEKTQRGLCVWERRKRQGGWSSTNINAPFRKYLHSLCIGLRGANRKKKMHIIALIYIFSQPVCGSSLEVVYVVGCCYPSIFSYA